MLLEEGYATKEWSSEAICSTCSAKFSVVEDDLSSYRACDDYYGYCDWLTYGQCPACGERRFFYPPKVVAQRLTHPVVVENNRWFARNAIWVLIILVILATVAVRVLTP